LFLFALFFVVHASNPQDKLSYGQLANSSIPPKYFSLLVDLPSLNSSTQPWAVHTLRKDIGFFRDLLDMFVYAFDNCSSSPSAKNDDCTDYWALLRKDVNDGYTLIGNYQDLNHSGVNYTNAQRLQLLDTCLSWLQTFNDDMKTYDYAAVVYTAQPDQMFERDKSKLSPYFWGQVQPTPDLSFTGLENLAVLEYALALESANLYSTVMSLSEVYTNKNHSIFHGYRKLSRSIISVASFNVLDTLNCTTDAMNTTVNMYNNFGNLNDEVTAYQFYKANGDQGQESIEQKIVVAGWASLQQWMDQTLWANQMECLMLSAKLPGLASFINIQ